MIIILTLFNVRSWNLFLYYSASKAPFQDLTMVIIGKLSISKAKLTARIRELGGTVAIYNSNNSVCISNKVEVDDVVNGKMGPNGYKMNQMRLCRVPVVDVSYVEDAAKGDAINKIPPHTISPWGDPIVIGHGLVKTDPNDKYKKGTGMSPSVTQAHAWKNLNTLYHKCPA